MELNHEKKDDLRKQKWYRNRVGEKDKRKGGVKIGKTVSGFRLELTG